MVGCVEWRYEIVRIREGVALFVCRTSQDLILQCLFCMLFLKVGWSSKACVVVDFLNIFKLSAKPPHRASSLSHSHFSIHSRVT